MSAKIKVTARSKPAKSLHTDDIVIPDKLYFRIGDVAKLCGLPTYVLRFWETEFAHLAPKKSSTGQRLYRQRDVENVVRIKKLLHEQGYTINGARQVFKQDSKPAKSQSALPFAAGHSKNHPALKQVRAGLADVMGILSKKK